MFQNSELDSCINPCHKDSSDAKYDLKPYF